MARTELKSIPTNVITGFLGVGKTTAIAHLLAQKPETERWAVLVNEFGDVAIDQQLLGAPGVFVREVAGGCICCAAGLPFQMALNFLLMKSRPDRVLIEPTGLGHPERILAMLRGEQFQDVLDVQATFCLLDPRQLGDKRYVDHESWQDQVNLADVLVFTKADLASPEQLKDASNWAMGLQPVRRLVATVSEGQLQKEWLTLTPVEGLVSCFGNEHRLPEPGHSHNHSAPSEAPKPQLGQPCYFENHGLGVHGKGWIFHPQERFDFIQLKQAVTSCLDEVEVIRFKGVFNTSAGWLAFNWVSGEGEWQPIEVQPDSRLEVITTAPIALSAFTQQLGLNK